MLIKYGTILEAPTTTLDYGLITDPATAFLDYGLILDLFPDLPGLTWAQTRRSIWRTLSQEAFSGKEVCVGAWSYPRHVWSLEWEMLRSDTLFQELQTLAGFIDAHAGKGRSWYYEDPEDCSVTDQLLGLGDGVTASFQLVRDYGEFRAEPIKSINGDPVIYLDGVPTTAWTMSLLGLITFTAAPPLRTVITADFSYYWKVRFLEDENEFEALWYKFWSQKKLEFISKK